MPCFKFTTRGKICPSQLPILALLIFDKQASTVPLCLVSLILVYNYRFLIKEVSSKWVAFLVQPCRIRIGFLQLIDFDHLQCRLG
jgi:hypothetical protein